VNATLARAIGSPTKLYIQWEPPEEPNGIILAYSVYCKSETAINRATIMELGSSSFSSTSGSGSAVLKNIMSGSGEENFAAQATPDYAILVDTNGTQSATYVNDLIPFTTYECYITANTSVGEGESSVILRATTDESSKVAWLSKSICCYNYQS